MKKRILNFSRFIFTVGITLTSLIQVNAQCSVSTSVAYNAPGNYHATTIPTVPANWEQHITVDFGDGTSGYTYNGTANSYGGGHIYSANGTYLVSTYMSAYDPADTSISCNAYDFDSVVVSNLPCSITVSSINANQTGSLYDYSFNSSYVSGNPGIQTSWVVKDSLGNILTTLNAYDNTNFAFSFQQNGYYVISFAAYAYDSLTSTACSDSTSLGMHVGTNQTTTCNAAFYLWEDSTSVGQWHAINYSTGSGALTYMWDFGDGTTSTLAYPSHNYAVPGNYVICLTIVDANGCSSSTCDSTAALRISQQQSINSIMGSLTVTAPTVGISQNQSILPETKVFPSPITENTILTFNSDSFSNGKLEIVNVLGQIVISSEVSILKGNNQLKINSSNLETGFYNINIISEGTIIAHVKALK